MAVAFTNLGASAAPDFTSATDLTSYANASWTPPTTGVIVLAIYSGHATGLDAVSSVTGNSLTWEFIIDRTFNTATRRLSVYAALAAPATTGATTVSFGANTSICVTMLFCQVTAASYGATAAAQFINIVTATGSTGTAAVTLAAASNANNRAWGTMGSVANATITTSGTNWVTGDDLGGTGPTRWHHTQWNATAFDTSVAATLTAANWGCIGMEVVDAAGAAAATSLLWTPPPTRYIPLGGGF